MLGTNLTGDYMKLSYIVLIIIIAVLMTGCAAFDAPKFQPNQYNLDLQLKIIPTEDFRVLAQKYNYPDLGGLTVYKDFKGTCKIYVPMLREVRDPYRMCVLGHEVFHCILGSFHKKGEGATCYQR